MFGKNIDLKSKLAAVEADLVSAFAQGTVQLHAEIFNKFAELIEDENDIEAGLDGLFDLANPPKVAVGGFGSFGAQQQAPSSLSPGLMNILSKGLMLAGPIIAGAKFLSGKAAHDRALQQVQMEHPELFQQNPQRATALFEAVYSSAPNIGQNSVLMGDLLTQLMSMPMVDMGTIARLIEMAKNVRSSASPDKSMSSQIANISNQYTASKLQGMMGGAKKANFIPARFKDAAGLPTIFNWGSEAAKTAGLTDAFTGSGTTMNQANQATQFNQQESGNTLLPLDSVLQELLKKEMELQQREQALTMQEQQVQQALQAVQQIGSKYQDETGVDPNSGAPAAAPQEAAPAGAAPEAPMGEEAPAGPAGEVGEIPAEEPMGDAPMGDAPMAEEPTGEEPMAEEPTGDVPMGEEPVGEEQQLEGELPPEAAGEEPVAGVPDDGGDAEGGAIGEQPLPPFGADGEGEESAEQDPPKGEGDGPESAEGVPAAEDGGEAPAGDENAEEPAEEPAAEESESGEAPAPTDGSESGEPAAEDPAAVLPPAIDESPEAQAAGQAGLEDAAAPMPPADQMQDDGSKPDLGAAQPGEAQVEAPVEGTSGEPPMVDEQFPEAGATMDPFSSEYSEGSSPMGDESSSMPEAEAKPDAAEEGEEPTDGVPPAAEQEESTPSASADEEEDDGATLGGETGSDEAPAEEAPPAAGPNTAESVEGSMEDNAKDEALNGAGIPEGSPAEAKADEALAEGLNEQGITATPAPAAPAAPAAPMAPPAAPPVAAPAAPAGGSQQIQPGVHEMVLPLRITVKIGEADPAIVSRSEAVKDFHAAMLNLPR